MLTTRLRMPSFMSCSCAATQRETSLPVADEEHLGAAAGGIGQDVGALGEPRGGRVLRAIERGQRLPRQDRAPPGSWRSRGSRARPRPPRWRRTGRIVIRPGNRAQRQELLDGLVRRAVLAHADRVVREDVDDRDLHDRGQADRRAAVVAEDQEARAVGPDLRQRQAVEDRAHGVLADAEMEVAAARTSPPRSRRRRRRSGASWSRAPGRPSRR